MNMMDHSEMARQHQGRYAKIWHDWKQTVLENDDQWRLAHKDVEIVSKGDNSVRTYSSACVRWYSRESRAAVQWWGGTAWTPPLPRSSTRAREPSLDSARWTSSVLQSSVIVSQTGIIQKVECKSQEHSRTFFGGKHNFSRTFPERHSHSLFTILSTKPCDSQIISPSLTILTKCQY